MVIVVAVVDVVVMAEMEVIVVLQYSIRIVVVVMATKDVNHCIRSSRDRFGCYAELQIIVAIVFEPGLGSRSLFFFCFFVSERAIRC